MKDIKIKDNERVDDLQCKGYRLIQDPTKFCFGLDAVLLSDFARVSVGEKVLDMCTGTGIIPILMAAKTEADSFKAIEIQPEFVDMARRSVALNDLENRIDIIEGDIKHISEYIPKSSMDAVTCNPPYMIEKHGIINEMDSKTIARHEIMCSLEDVVRAGAVSLRPGGNFCMIHRPFRLTEILVMLTKYKLEPKRIRFVYPYVDKEPNMVMIEAKRGGKSRVTVEKPLIVYESVGKYTEEIYKIYGRSSKN